MVKRAPLDSKQMELFDFDALGMGGELLSVGGGYEEQHIPAGAMAYAPGLAAPYAELLAAEGVVGGLGAQMGGRRRRSVRKRSGRKRSGRKHKRSTGKQRR